VDIVFITSTFFTDIPYSWSSKLGLPNKTQRVRGRMTVSNGTESLSLETKCAGLASVS